MSLQAITAEVANRAAAAGGAIDATIKFVLSEGCVFVDGNANPPTVNNNDDEADCTVIVSTENFEAMLSGETNPMVAFMGGQMQIEGDMSIAMKLGALFS